MISHLQGNAISKQLRPLLLLLLAAVAAPFLCLWSWHLANPVDNDFFGLYALAKVGPRGLYNPENFRAVAAALHAQVSEARFYCARMPYYALGILPLGWTTFAGARTAWAVTQALLITVSISLWPRRRILLATITLVSIPAAFLLAQGNDTALVLFAIAVAVAMAKKGWSLAAGVIFSVCLIKPHLVLFVPLVFLSRRNFRFLPGAALGTTAQIAISFGVAARSWPRQWVASILNPAMHPYPWAMPGLRTVAQSGFGTAVVILLVIGAGFAIWRCASRESLEGAVALAVAAGILINLHSYLVDCILLLPAVALALGEGGVMERIFGIFLATPVPYVFLLMGHPNWLQAGISGLLLSHGARVLRRPQYGKALQFESSGVAQIDGPAPKTRSRLVAVFCLALMRNLSSLRAVFDTSLPGLPR